ncbi:hypothetical protein RI129_000448 [Pyrocoelia pectoralis]|uniref:Uncharacterized protein n=1 Tax=Pyrocoelia pectoralis TaxID=417401 RepID=A0AAN7VRK7_9COLE
MSSELQGKIANKNGKFKRKFYFPCSSIFKSHPFKRRKKGTKSWIKIGNSFGNGKRVPPISCEKTTRERNIEIISSSPPLSYTCRKERVSPVLKFSRDKCSIMKESSPPLKCSYSKLERISPVINNKVTFNYNFHISDNELSNSETSFGINCCEQSVVSSNDITEFLSQDCSIMEFNDTEPHTCDLQQLYYNPPVKKKKSYKKNGLAFALQKALLRKSAQLTFWEHELEHNKGINIEDDSTLSLKIHHRWTEYGIHLFECENVKLTESNICLVLLGFGVSKNISTNVNRIKIYSPYLTKSVDYKGSSRLCYYNVSKIT